MAGSHSPIVSAELFEHVQSELQRRKDRGNIPSSSCFSGRIVYGDCGNIYGSKVWHSTSKYKRTIWQCNGKFKGDEKCSTPHLYEKDIQRIFLDIVNSLIEGRQSILQGLEEALMEITDNTALEKERDALQEECEVLLELLRKMVQDNATVSQGQADYKVKESGLREHLSGRFHHPQALVDNDEPHAIQTPSTVYLPVWYISTASAFSSTG